METKTVSSRLSFNLLNRFSLITNAPVDNLSHTS